MSYTSELKKSLNNCINNLADKRDDYCFKVGKGFTRKRKSEFQSIVKVVLCFCEKSLNKELLEYFGFSPDALSASAFIQQRAKIKLEAFYQLFKDFTHINQNNNQLFHRYRLLAINGSDICTLKKPENIIHEIFAQLIIYNFSELVISHIAIRKKKISSQNQLFCRCLLLSQSPVG